MNKDFKYSIIILMAVLSAAYFVMRPSKSDDIIIQNKSVQDENEPIPTNKYLWRASLDTLSFLPISSVDTFAGAMETDWAASPENPDERIRVSLRLVSLEFSKGSIEINVYREELSSNGSWIAEPVDQRISEEIKNAIFARASELKELDN